MKTKPKNGIKFHKEFAGRERYWPMKTKKDMSVGDCVMRAVAHATERDYKKVWDEMFDYGKENGLLPNDDLVSDYMLIKAGFKKMPAMVDKNNRKYILNEVPIDTSKIYVFRMSGHLIAINKGKYIDIADCGWCKVFSYYIK